VVAIADRQVGLSHLRYLNHKDASSSSEMVSGGLSSSCEFYLSCCWIPVKARLVANHLHLAVSVTRDSCKSTVSAMGVNTFCEADLIFSPSSTGKADFFSLPSLPSNLSGRISHITAQLSCSSLDLCA